MVAPHPGRAQLLARHRVPADKNSIDRGEPVKTVPIPDTAAWVVIADRSRGGTI